MNGGERLSGGDPRVRGTLLIFFFASDVVVAFKQDRFVTNCPACLYIRTLTNDLEAPVLLKLSDIPRTEPTLAVLIHKELLLVSCFLSVVSHCDIGSANHNLSSRAGLVCASVTT